MKSFALLTAATALFASAALAAGTPAADKPIVLAAGTSCSTWKATCETRGAGCAPKFKACLKNGCWTEGAAFGGATHCGLAKQ
jgi:hypothetical protein